MIPVQQSYYYYKRIHFNILISKSVHKLTVPYLTPSNLRFLFAM